MNSVKWSITNRTIAELSLWWKHSNSREGRANSVTALWQSRGVSIKSTFPTTMSRFAVDKHYGEWMLSRWYDNIPGPDRLIEVSTSLTEVEAFNLVNAWSKKLLTPGLDPERLNSITESLISSHWNQACRMGCLAVQITYINGFYHRFVWRVS